MLVYLFVGVITFYNGALIEQISDAWWHMSKANAIATNETIWGQLHLNGAANRWYPPLWHTNLAVIQRLSSESLPVLWNSATVWLSIAKVMAYYMFAYSLTRRKSVALLAISLFVLLPGMGVSYLRVSAWPSHVAYMMMFFALGLCFRVLDATPSNVQGLRNELVYLFSKQYIVISFLALVLILIFFTHQLEVLWFAIAVSLYALAVACCAQFKPMNQVEGLASVIKLLAVIFLLTVSALSFWLLAVHRPMVNGITDRTLAHLGFAILPIILLGMSYTQKAKPKLFFYSFCAMLVLISIDFQHFYALVAPEFSLPKPAYHEMPLLTQGWLGDDLRLPDWDLQLRHALLLSGMLAVPLIVFQFILEPARESLFLATTSLVAIFFCLSPYAYQWLSDVSGYHSPWRIMTLHFTPLIFSLVVCSAFHRVFLRSDLNGEGGRR